MSSASVLKALVAAVVIAAAALGIVSLVSESASGSLRTGRQRSSVLVDLDVEVVLSHFNEKLDWVNAAREQDSNIRYTVYSKSPNAPQGALRLKNVGREGHTFLYHIVRNYNSLADWTVFSQAAAPGFGFIHYDHESGHLCSGVEWENYLQPYPNGEDFYMVHTVATKFPQMWHSDRLDMMFRLPDSKGDLCPANAEEGWGGWWTDKDHPLVKFQHTEEGKGAPSAMEFYNEFIVADASNIDYKSVTLNFANGGRFAVSRERILRRPLIYYKNLLAQLSRHVNPIEGFFLEASWYDVFHPDHLQAQYGPICSLPLLGEGATSHSTMHRAAVQKIFGQPLVPQDLQTSGPYIQFRSAFLRMSGPYLENQTPIPNPEPTPEPTRTPIESSTSTPAPVRSPGRPVLRPGDQPYWTTSPFATLPPSAPPTDIEQTGNDVNIVLSSDVPSPVPTPAPIVSVPTVWTPSPFPPFSSPTASEDRAIPGISSHWSSSPSSSFSLINEGDPNIVETAGPSPDPTMAAAAPSISTHWTPSPLPPFSQPSLDGDDPNVVATAAVPSSNPTIAPAAPSISTHWTPSPFPPLSGTTSDGDDPYVVASAVPSPNPTTAPAAPSISMHWTPSPLPPFSSSGGDAANDPNLVATAIPSAQPTEAPTADYITFHSTSSPLPPVPNGSTTTSAFGDASIVVATTAPSITPTASPTKQMSKMQNDDSIYSFGGVGSTAKENRLRGERRKRK